MGDFLDAIGQGIGGMVAGSMQVISQVFDSLFGFLSPVVPAPMIPFVVGGAALLVGAWFLLRR